MIRINLLPQSERERFSYTEKQIAAALFLLIVTGTVFGGLSLLTGSKLKVLEEKQMAGENRRLELLEHVSRANELEQRIELKETRIRNIRNIRIHQQLPVNYLATLVRKLPDQKLWFETLRLDQEGSVEIQGVALDNQVFARYVNSLRKSQFFRSVSTQRTSHRQIMDQSLVEFEFRIQAGPVRE